MRFFASLVTVLSLSTAAVFAQHADIAAPNDLTEVAAGSEFTATIEQADSNSSWENIALVIALLPCGPSGQSCHGPAEEMGTILYSGPFNPSFSTPSPGGTPAQSFTLTVPADFATGNAQLGVALFDLVGALLFPSLQTFNTTIVVT